MLRFFNDETARTTLAIKTLLNEFQAKETEEAKRIVILLNATKTFLVATDPLMQLERDAYINDLRIEKIFNQAGSSLKVFQNAIGEHKINDDCSAALIYCEKVYDERLKELKEKHDKIFDYYNTHDNQLKEILSPLFSI